MFPNPVCPQYGRQPGCGRQDGANAERMGLCPVRAEPTRPGSDPRREHPSRQVLGMWLTTRSILAPAAGAGTLPALQARRTRPTPSTVLTPRAIPPASAAAASAVSPRSASGRRPLEPQSALARQPERCNEMPVGGGGSEGG